MLVAGQQATDQSDFVLVKVVKNWMEDKYYPAQKTRTLSVPSPPVPAAIFANWPEATFLLPFSALFASLRQGLQFCWVSARCACSANYAVLFSAPSHGERVGVRG